MEHDEIYGVNGKDNSLLRLYLSEIRKYKSLEKETEIELSKKILNNGDKNAIDTLVKANLRFVVMVARNYQNQGMQLVDLINEGNTGLITAAKRFDYRKNFKFISYAVWQIRQAILKALAEQSRIVNIPTNEAGKLYTIRQKEAKLEQRYGREPDTKEIAQEMEIEEEKVDKMVQIAKNHLSIYTTYGDDDCSLLEKLTNQDDENPDNSIEKVSLSKEINQTLEKLMPKERDIITLYFGIDNGVRCTLEDIGEQLDLTRERVRQIKERAIKKLKQNGEGKNLRDYYSN